MHRTQNDIKNLYSDLQIAFTSQIGLLFSEQEATSSDKSPLLLAFSATQFSLGLVFPFKGPAVSCSEYISPEPHTMLFFLDTLDLSQTSTSARPILSLKTNFQIELF
jgi:hypothetical protein